MTTSNNGGPAFPIHHVHPKWIIGQDGKETFYEGFYGKEGITLRDYFAAKAMEAIINDSNSANSVAIYAYEQADSMLAERDK